MDNWTEISNGDFHTTLMMPVPGGALIRHVEFDDPDRDRGELLKVAVSICFVPSGDGSPLGADQFSHAGASV